jgi:hypothetical protein
MKKFLIVTLAVLSIAAQSHAAVEERAKDDVVARQHMMDAMKAAHAAGKVNEHVVLSTHTASSSGLMDKLNPNQAQALGKGMHDSMVSSKVDKVVKAVASAKLTRDEGQILIETLANAASLDSKYRDNKAAFGLPADKAKQAFVSLAFGAGDAVGNWEAKSVKNMIEVARVANEDASAGRYESAMDRALTKLRELSKNPKLTMDDLIKLCPPVA